MDTVKLILQRKSATISLHELESFCEASEYEALVSEVNGLVDSGVICVMGRDTNGMFPPLHSRYRIIRPTQDLSDLKDEVLRLGPDFNPSGYLANIGLYIKHRDLLRGLHDYLRDNGAQLDINMSKNERSYAIWGYEKQLDDAVCKNMLRFTGWDSRLNFYNTPEPFFDYLCDGDNTESILILENKDIWFSLRKLYMENRTACRLYGVFIDGLLYGEGKKITRLAALENYAREGFSGCPSFYYWGDLDYEGIGIYLAVAAGFPLQLFVPGYLAMLSYAKEQTLTQCRTVQSSPPQIDEFLDNFDHSSATQIKTLLESGKYIPQEICNYPRLRAAMDET